ncbi:MAG TPA: DUF3891 family protein [Thermoanaerobaculia bacterium]|nr:DUF3891 family protein [Thermoanaerobaculia bacterium]
MIVVDEGSSFLLVTQPDHARFSGELLSLWRADGLPAHPRRADLLFAAREHDNGWREADAAPRWDAARGRPHDFTSLPAADRVEIWERGVARYAGSRPYAALLIVRHALQLFGERRGDPGWEGLFALLDELAAELFATTGAGAEELAADYRFLDLADLASLAVCSHWLEPFRRHDLEGRPAPGRLALDPFPLAGATTFAVPCRRVPRRVYGGDADLGGALAAARWERLAVKVVEPAGRE